VIPDGAVVAWEDALLAHAHGRIGDGDLACAYVADRVRRAHPKRWLQAPRPSPLPCASTYPVSIALAARHLRGVCGEASAALAGWASGARPAVLYRRVLTAREVLTLQARGRRCVSLLDDGADPSPHEDGLAFAQHDLCHLENFVSNGHEGQVGFFATLGRALDDLRWSQLEGALDAGWAEERDYVLADMNGVAPFLFVSLRSRLKLAIRRAAAERRGGPARTGPLDDEEARAFEGAFALLLELLAAHAPGEGAFPFDAARALASRRDAARDAEAVEARFAEAGRAALAAASGPRRRSSINVVRRMQR
jgi:hypothetical protein